MTEQGRAPRIARKVGRGLLRAAFSVLLFFGFSILFAPVMYVAGSHSSFPIRNSRTPWAAPRWWSSPACPGGALGVDTAASSTDGAGRKRPHRDRRAGAACRQFRRARGGVLSLPASLRDDRAAEPLFLRLRKLSIGFSSLVTNDLESYVSQAISRVGPLVALGHPGEAIEAGRILTGEENWKTDIGTLMKRAKGILLVPADRPGTLWEIDTLKQEGLLGKVIFVMPPCSAGQHDTRQRWESARQALRDRGLETPDYDERGMLFVLEADGRVSNVEPLLLTSARQVRKSLKRLLTDAQPPAGCTQRSRAHTGGSGAPPSGAGRKPSPAFNLRRRPAWTGRRASRRRLQPQ